MALRLIEAREVGGRVERGHGLHAGVWDVAAGRQPRVTLGVGREQGEEAAGGAAKEGDPVRFHAVAAGVLLDPADRALHVAGSVLPAGAAARAGSRC